MNALCLMPLAGIVICAEVLAQNIDDGDVMNVTLMCVLSVGQRRGVKCEFKCTNWL